MLTTVRIHDMPAHERPRERLVAKGADSLNNGELVAILLRTGMKGVSALDAANRLVAHYGRLDALAAAPLEDLCKFPGIGRDKAVTLKAAFTLARKMAAEMRHESPLLDTPDRVADLLREELRHESSERFIVVLLNSRRRLIRTETLSNGTLDTVFVHARDVFRGAIVANASALVIAHNHPSGDPTPSESDIKVTRDLIRAGQLLKIELLDHVILGRATSERAKDWVSLKELGLFHS